MRRHAMDGDERTSVAQRQRVDQRAFDGAGDGGRRTHAEGEAKDR